ncbi:MAG: ABC transporter ATP-binding protein [Clostridia bacterium]|nr:ABC transporter ATP-binding protein [Clostridia bacterium]
MAKAQPTKSPYLIELNNVSLKFNLPNEKIDNIKEYIIKFLKGKLKYNEFWVLNDINLKVKRGESLALIGRNGCGKSTLLKLIAGIFEPTKGTVQVNGSIAPLINLGAGFDMEATAEENIYLNGAILGYSKKDMKEKYNRIVEFSELRNFMQTPLKNFSSGMLARLGFSIAVDVKPDLLIVDEILAVGDTNFQKKCYDRIRELLAEGTTMIFVSHNIKTVQELCQNALWIKNNRTHMFGSSKDVCMAYKKECEAEMKASAPVMPAPAPAKVEKPKKQPMVKGSKKVAPKKYRNKKYKTAKK